MEKGFKNLCSSLFFQQFFLSFLHLHILPQGQTGGEGWWVVNSPCLSAHTNINLTLAFFPHFFYIHIGGDLAAFHRVFSFFFWELHFVEKGFKNSCSSLFFQQFFFLFTLTHITTRAVRWGRLVGGKFPMPVCPYTHQLDTAISLPIFFFHLIVLEHIKIQCCSICTLFCSRNGGIVGLQFHYFWSKLLMKFILHKTFSVVLCTLFCSRNGGIVGLQFHYFWSKLLMKFILHKTFSVVLFVLCFAPEMVALLGCNSTISGANY